MRKNRPFCKNLYNVLILLLVSRLQESLIEKIKATPLFSDEEKKVIVEVVPSLTESELEKLEETIDDYQESIVSVISKYKAQLAGDIETLKNSEKEDEKKLGENLSKIFSSIN